MALACDIRLAAADAILGMPQITQGTIPWDGGTQRLPRIVGRAWATDLLLTGRLIDAQEALKIGLVHEVASQDQLMERAERLASTIAALGPVATRYAKEAILKGMDMTLDQGMRLEMDLNLLLQTTADRAEGIASFLERRQPNFTGG
jgi:enoyl-CoA hydratase/carnithine racemase